MHLSALRSSPPPMHFAQRSVLLSARARAARLTSVAAIGFFAALTTGCNNDDPVQPGSAVSTVEIVPARVALEVGASVPLQFVGHRADGSVVDGLTPKW